MCIKRHTLLSNRVIIDRTQKKQRKKNDNDEQEFVEMRYRVGTPERRIYPSSLSAAILTSNLRIDNRFPATPDIAFAVIYFGRKLHRAKSSKLLPLPRKLIFLASAAAVPGRAERREKQRAPYRPARGKVVGTGGAISANERAKKKKKKTLLPPSTNRRYIQ